MRQERQSMSPQEGPKSLANRPAMVKKTPPEAGNDCTRGGRSAAWRSSTDQVITERDTETERKRQ